MRVRDRALEIIRERISRGDPLYDFTGLASRPKVDAASDELRTYLSEALILPEIRELCREHFDAPKYEVMVVPRTTAAVIATILALEPRSVLHVLPEGGEAHPCVEEGCRLAGAEYEEVEESEKSDLNGFDLVVVTGCDVRWNVVSEDTLREVASAEAVTLLDDASGDRVRRLHGQKPGPRYGFDLVVTSCDKLMDGPRAGILIGRDDLVEDVRRVCEGYGWTVDGPTLAAVKRALEEFEFSSLEARLKELERVYERLKDELDVERTGAGLVFRGVEREVEIGLRLLRRYGIMTITALGYERVDRTLRFNLLTEDAERFGYDRFVEVVKGELS
ncbi:TIGR03576 family pyridoxal phosphate-dependent enzyme [Methanopyrus sp.]